MKPERRDLLIWKVSKAHSQKNYETKNTAKPKYMYNKKSIRFSGGMSTDLLK